jgi:beta-lactamase superfamily II metal-dependent hydrolase
MGKVHYLNVGTGDCIVIEANSGRKSMFDICNGNAAESLHEAKTERASGAKPRGNFQMCSQLTNPLDYLSDRGISSLFRFILSHPDMDHMDGLNKLFDKISISNFWDSGVRRDAPDFSVGGYSESDWDRYEAIIGGSEKGLTVINPLAGDNGKYWAKDDQEEGGDYLSIVAPDSELVAAATDSGEINDASYVVVYRSAGGKIVFPGDSHDKTWDYILENHESLVKDATVLIAPHHGRASSRKRDFLDVVNPKVTLFGCAPSEHLDYSGWDNRGLLFFTNNQCGNVVIETSAEGVDLFVQNGTYAEKYTGSRDRKNAQGYFFLYHAS